MRQLTSMASWPSGGQLAIRWSAGHRIPVRIHGRKQAIMGIWEIPHFGALPEAKLPPKQLHFTLTGFRALATVNVSDLFPVLRVILGQFCNSWSGLLTIYAGNGCFRTPRTCAARYMRVLPNSGSSALWDACNSFEVIKPANWAHLPVNVTGSGRNDQIRRPIDRHRGGMNYGHLPLCT